VYVKIVEVGTLSLF